MMDLGRIARCRLPENVEAGPSTERAGRRDTMPRRHDPTSEECFHLETLATYAGGRWLPRRGKQLKVTWQLVQLVPGPKRNSAHIAVGCD